MRTALRLKVVVGLILGLVAALYGSAYFRFGWLELLAVSLVGLALAALVVWPRQRRPAPSPTGRASWIADLATDVTSRALALGVVIYLALSVGQCEETGGEPSWGVFGWKPLPGNHRAWPWVHPRFNEPPWYDPGT